MIYDRTQPNLPDAEEAVEIIRNGNEWMKFLKGGAVEKVNGY